MNSSVSTKFTQEEINLLEDKIEFDPDTRRFHVIDYTPLRLGEFIKRLERCISTDEWNNAKIITNKLDVYVSPGFHSYRGDYSEIAADCSQTEQICTAGDLLRIAKDSIGKEFEGWKGGLFQMESYTPLWFSERGESWDYVAVDVFQSTQTPNCIEINLINDGFDSDYFQST